MAATFHQHFMKLARKSCVTSPSPVRDYRAPRGEAPNPDLFSKALVSVLEAKMHRTRRDAREHPLVETKTVFVDRQAAIRQQEKRAFDRRLDRLADIFDDFEGTPEYKAALAEDAVQQALLSAQQTVARHQAERKTAIEQARNLQARQSRNY